ncbi:hypothetical protein BEL04_08175 [Mucilaginibacter sp. PPCGB 2223]|uniref:hypothetical protein n=1 Tax=Mucilaginibacter sp. PPCGB 2223 TaxID=1886027 RepID=UPI000824B91A|nr:hypothetical protein [Mucilaginibacter sp. PPCGB 2223]OCX54225.1 hypothetical protein BEL04_08175 [Mucilaginibacter sp. PPCGB 2223]
MKAIEREFFCSLSQICAYYEMTMPDVNGLVYPQNVFRAWEQIAHQVKQVDKKMDCVIMTDKKHQATLATVKQMDTGMTLYYIPVRPLWNWAQQAEHQAIAEMLTAIFAYLHQIVKIPFYTENDSYLYAQYETLGQWLDEGDYDEDNEEEKEWQEIQSDALYVAQNSGLHIYRLIIQPEYVSNFRQTIADFEVSNTCDLEWLGLANEFYELSQDHPNRSIFDNIRPDLYYPEEEERIDAEQYISFYWSGTDCLSDTLDDMINTNFQEISIMDEPLAVQVFDGLTPITNETFDFETKLFELLNKLSSLLNKYDYEEREPTI